MYSICGVPGKWPRTVLKWIFPVAAMLTTKNIPNPCISVYEYFNKRSQVLKYNETPLVQKMREEDVVFDFP